MLFVFGVPIDIENKFSVSFGPRPKLNNKMKLKAKNFFEGSGVGNILKGLTYGSNSIIASHGNLGRLASDYVSL